MAASLIRCVCQNGKDLIRSKLKETYCRQKRLIKFRREDNQYVPKVVPYRTYPNEALEERYPEVEISAEDFKYVERLFPPKSVPIPPEHEKYPTASGWYPPNSSVQETAQPYYLHRSKNHMLPVYVHVHDISRQVTTVVKHVIGDIRLLDKDIKHHLKEKTGKDIPSQVHEVGMYLRFRGNHSDIIAQYLLDKGF